MHDWILLSMLFDWGSARLTINFRDSKSKPVSLIAENVVSFIAPKKNEWGRSDSVNKIEAPVCQQDGVKLVLIEMQSGDAIQIFAQSFIFPNAT
ncbi:MAG: hypothetical protein EOP04_12095 [Proteobacteria bacterium]|jgi:hypothetical protein|nr:MAG: hypothetical protein EOP04_12095 [Pseudomonadota bacterium]